MQANRSAWINQIKEGVLTLKNLKKLTILHSNDMHGDFLSKTVDQKLIGGVSMLSGYIQKVRQENENVIYAIAGDMFRGSLIDSEFKGISTIEIMNLLAPDVVTLGNHEVDYGLAHLLFLEKCAKFPIINANMYITINHKRLFRSHIVLKVGGMKILFIGILTEEVLNSTRQEKLIGSLVDIEDAAKEVGRICNSYRSTDIDFTVLLTHIGFESDKRLAAVLDPRWGVDVIIGGHSHTLLEKPEIVAGIPIVQAAVGTAQIGRFDIMVDTDNNCIDSFNWELVPIDEAHCPRDLELEDVIEKYKTVTDAKYGRIVTRFMRKYTHPARNMPTELGSIFADALREGMDMDVMFLASGSIRKKELGPLVRLQDLMEVFPFDQELLQITVTGAQLRRMILHLMRPEAFTGETEFYQFSKGFLVRYNRETRQLEELSLNGKAITDDQKIRIGLQSYHAGNLPDFFGITKEEVLQNGEFRELATSCCDLAEEYFNAQKLVRADRKPRLIFTEKK